MQIVVQNLGGKRGDRNKILTQSFVRVSAGRGHTHFVATGDRVAGPGVCDPRLCVASYLRPMGMEFQSMGARWPWDALALDGRC